MALCLLAFPLSRSAPILPCAALISSPRVPSSRESPAVSRAQTKNFRIDPSHFHRASNGLGPSRVLLRAVSGFIWPLSVEASSLRFYSQPSPDRAKIPTIFSVLFHLKFVLVLPDFAYRIPG